MASSVALADAGIEMVDLVTPSSLVFNDIDPTLKERLHPSIIGSLTIAYLPLLNQVSCLTKDGEQSIDDSIASVNKCIEAYLWLHFLMKDCLVS